jgi:hypothetical protein
MKNQIKNQMKKITFLLILLLLNLNSFATKIFGLVTDEKNNPMPFVTVYVEQINNKTNNSGTVTNMNGEFALPLADGEYTVVFRFVGYKSVTETIKITGKDIKIDRQLQPESVTLKEVEISAKRKDPAYEIIKNAQNKRKFYLQQAQTYTAGAYIKGLQKIDEAPKKVMGRDITLPGAEPGDSVNRAIVYLSESLSDLYIDGSNRKEIVTSSKVSGRNNAFSWNSALDLQINLYENSIDMGGLSPRPFISPIAATAMVHYKYEYLGTVQENNLTLHKIKLLPKQKGTPVFNGIVYIQDDSWRIHSTELNLTKAEQAINFVDTLTLRQVYIPIEKDVWKISTQSVNFKWSVEFLGLKFKGSGYFLGAFSNYNLSPNIDKKMFSSETVKVLEESNKKDTTFWTQIRPFALSSEEARDYNRKDSIFKVRDSKAFKDSIDRKNNKPKAWLLLTGYTYRNSYKNYSLSFPSPLDNIQTNSVEGITINPKITFSRSNREKYSTFSWENDFRYGFSSQRFYAQTALYRRFNATNRANIGFSAGSYIAQFNGENPISPTVNSLYTTFFGQNYMKIYEKNYVKLRGGMEVINGLTLTASAELAHRVPLQNLNDFSGFTVNWFTDTKDFTSNMPQSLNDIVTRTSFEKNNLLAFDLEATIKFGQTYNSRPYIKINNPSKYPTLKLYYKHGQTYIASGNSSFDFFKASITDNLMLGQLGQSEYVISAGGFLNKPYFFMDYAHFNTTQTIFSNSRLNSYLLLPYYTFSTTEGYIEAHYEHHFNGFLTNRIGFMRKLGWTLVGSGHYLRNPLIGNYGELSIGLENIFKIIRAEVAFGFSELGNQNGTIGFRLQTTLF